MREFIIIFLLLLGFMATLSMLNTLDAKDKYIEVLQETIHALNHPIPAPLE